MSWTGDPRRDIAEVMKLIYTRGLAQVRGGNASIYDPTRRLVYMSPTGVPRNLLAPRDVAILTLEGKVLAGTPTSEWRMHLAVYKADPHARAAVHAHPRNLLALLYRGETPNPQLMTEVSLNAECITVVPYKKPGSQELADAVAESIRKTGCNVLILERHGALVYSRKHIYHALDLLEAIEDLSYIMLHLERG